MGLSYQPGAQGGNRAAPARQRNANGQRPRFREPRTKYGFH